jgi:hypothetical protein
VKILEEIMIDKALKMSQNYKHTSPTCMNSKQETKRKAFQDLLYTNSPKNKNENFL